MRQDMAGRQTSQQVAAAIAQIPECQRGQGSVFVNLPVCDQKRRALQAEVRGDRRQALRAALPTVMQSLVIDLAAVPQHPVAGPQGLNTLRNKYAPVWAARDFERTFASGTTPDAATSRELLVRFDALEAPLLDAERAMRARDDVRQAYLEGRIDATILRLDKVQSLRWGADRKTWVLASRLRQQMPGETLFMDRTKEHTESEREHGDMAGRARWGEPTATEIGLALMRVFTIPYGRFRSPYEAEYRAFGVVPAGSMRLVHVQKDGCQQSPEGWWCQVRAWMQFLPPDHAATMADEGQLYARFMQQANREAELGNGSTVVHLFKAGGLGWQAPGLDAKMEQREQARDKALSESVRSVNESICLGRQLSGDPWADSHPACTAAKKK